MKKVMLVFVFFICALGVNGQDSLSLKSGKSMTGQIVSFADSMVRIKTGSETFGYKLSEIESLRYNGPVTAENVQVPEKTETGNSDVKKRRKESGMNPVKIEQ